MARLHTLGFEINSTTNGMEFDTYSGSPTIDSTTVRSGVYSGRISSLSSGTPKYFSTIYSAGVSQNYVRVYTRFATLPSAENRFIVLNNSNDLTTPIVYMTVDNTGTLKLYDEDGQISGTATVGTGTWYRIEISCLGTGGSNTVEAKVDGATAFATSGARNLSASPTTLIVGGNLNSEAQTTGDWNFDDLAMNDDSDVHQNGYPGAGNVIVRFATAQGAANGWLKTNKSTAGSSTNYQLVDENPPNDATDFVSSSTANAEDLYTYAATEIVSGDTINLTHVNVRWANDVASTQANLSADLEFVTAGTDTTGSSYGLNTTTWKTNADASNSRLTPKFTNYTDYNNNPYTKSVIDGGKFGIKLVNGGSANFILVSAVWLTVDYVVTPPSFNVKNSSFMMAGTGMGF